MPQPDMSRPIQQADTTAPNRAELFRGTSCTPVAPPDDSGAAILLPPAARSDFYAEAHPEVWLANRAETTADLYGLEGADRQRYIELFPLWYERDTQTVTANSATQTPAEEAAFAQTVGLATDHAYERTLQLSTTDDILGLQVDPDFAGQLTGCIPVVFPVQEGSLSPDSDCCGRFKTETRVALVEQGDGRDNELVGRLTAFHEIYEGMARIDMAFGEEQLQLRRRGLLVQTDEGINRVGLLNEGVVRLAEGAFLERMIDNIPGVEALVDDRAGLLLQNPAEFLDIIGQGRGALITAVTAHDTDEERLLTLCPWIRINERSEPYIGGDVATVLIARTVGDIIALSRDDGASTGIDAATRMKRARERGTHLLDRARLATDIDLFFEAATTALGPDLGRFVLGAPSTLAIELQLNLLGSLVARREHLLAVAPATTDTTGSLSRITYAYGSVEVVPTERLRGYLSVTSGVVDSVENVAPPLAKENILQRLARSLDPEVAKADSAAQLERVADALTTIEDDSGWEPIAGRASSFSRSIKAGVSVLHDSGGSVIVVDDVVSLPDLWRQVLARSAVRTTPLEGEQAGAAYFLETQDTLGMSRAGTILTRDDNRQELHRCLDLDKAVKVHFPPRRENPILYDVRADFGSHGQVDGIDVGNTGFKTIFTSRTATFHFLPDGLLDHPERTYGNGPERNQITGDKLADTAVSHARRQLREIRARNGLLFQAALHRLVTDPQAVALLKRARTLGREEGPLPLLITSTNVLMHHFLERLFGPQSSAYNGHEVEYHDGPAVLSSLNLDAIVGDPELLDRLSKAEKELIIGGYKMVDA